MVNKGVNTIAARVEQVVMATDSATLALAKNAITLDAVPPGQHATNMRPTAKKGGRSKRGSQPPP